MRKYKYIYVDEERRVYYGLAETLFKERHRHHVRDFKHEIY